MTGENSLIYNGPLGIIILVMAISMYVLYSVGLYASNYYLRGTNTNAKEDIKEANNGLTLFAFIFLLLAFTFSLSLSRYDMRRTIIYEEANCIGTAILRTDLYPDSVRTTLRNEFKDYVEARIAYYEAQKLGKEAVYPELARGAAISHKIWETAVRTYKEQPSTSRDNQMLPALNAMIDITTSRDANRLARVPDEIIYLLLTSILVGSFLAGYDKKSWVVLTLFAVMTLMTIYTILDLDRPQQGFIRSDLTHNKIVELRKMF